MAKAVAKRKPTEVANLDDEMAKYKGMGTSQAADDNLTPFAYILQDNSPQVKKKGSEYIDGAEAGDIWLKNAADEIAKGEEGFVFQPCNWYRAYVEWDEDRNFVASYDYDDGPPSDCEKDEENPYKLRRPNGNDVVDTRYLVGNVVRDDGLFLPYVIPFKSTGHAVARGLSGKCNQKLDKDGDIQAAFCNMYRFKTKFVSKAKGDYYLFDISDERPCKSKEELDRGYAIFKAFEKGEAKVGVGKEVDESEDDDNF